MFRFIIALLLIFSTLDAKEHQSALNYLNSIRQDAGLIKLKPNKKLDKAAASHANYLVRQQKIGHYEKKGWSGYTGKTPSDRVLHAGYASKAVMENVTVNTKTSHKSIDTLFAAIYHRFVFLNFDKDEIGIGSASTKKKQSVTSSFVYNLGSTAISKLCKTSSFVMHDDVYYMQNLCKNSANIVPQILFEKKQNEIREKNSKIIFYPYPNATNVSPVFYTENPHPLPGSKVSGYPVSVQFNPAFYKKVKLKKFRLFDAEGKEIKKHKVLTHKNDKNRRFTPLQFAFMPLKRLEYGTTYRAEFEAVADGKRVKKSWKFTTKKPKGTFYKITKKKTTLKVKRGEKIVLYFEPRTKKDVLGRIKYTGKLHTTYLDKNTLLVTMPNKRSSRGYSLKAGAREVILK
ncbi:CAP domain-containing protein [Sulfurovum sp. CS9]|uniref:CAP domain-containing protein n=1 Tax=Sulfurovum sp. CS9 TaxID=3391146 RepID=UPI0039E8D552